MLYSTNSGSFNAMIPFALDAGTYTVNYHDINGLHAGSVVVTIQKAKTVLETAPQAKTLEYTGKYQELVTAGKTNVGELRYEYTYTLNGITNDVRFSGIPTAINSGTYQVRYYVEETKKYSGLDTNSFS